MYELYHPRTQDNQPVSLLVEGRLADLHHLEIKDSNLTLDKIRVDYSVIKSANKI